MRLEVLMTDDEKVKLAELDARCKSNTHQIDKLKSDISDIRSEQKAIYDINTNIQLMTQTMGIMRIDITDVKEDIGGVKEKVNILENKPANDTYKKFDIIKDKISWILIGGVTAYLLNQILPSMNW